MRIIIKTRLNTGGMDNPLMPKSRELDPEWLLPRVDMMCKYTFKSLEEQTDQDFLHVVEVRPETFELVEDHIRWPSHNMILARPGQMSRLAAKYCGDEEILYRMRLNSDDLLHRDLIKRLRAREVQPDTQAIIPNRGYFWYIEKGKMVKMERRCPPFYSLIYKTEQYVNGLRYELKGGHNTVLSLRHVFMKERNWTWIVHQLTSKIMRGSKYPNPNEHSKADPAILKEFGV